MSTLFCFGFQGCWEQDDRAWQYFFEKTIELKKCGKVNFLQIRHFFQRKLGKTVDLLHCYCNLLVAIGELQFDLHQHQKWPVKQKHLFRPLLMMYGSWDMERNRHIFLSFWTVFLPFSPLGGMLWMTRKSKFWKNEKHT